MRFIHIQFSAHLGFDDSVVTGGSPVPNINFFSPLINRQETRQYTCRITNNQAGPSDISTDPPHQVSQFVSDHSTVVKHPETLGGGGV